MYWDSLFEKLYKDYDYPELEMNMNHPRPWSIESNFDILKTRDLLFGAPNTMSHIKLLGREWRFENHTSVTVGVCGYYEVLKKARKLDYAFVSMVSMSPLQVHKREMIENAEQIISARETAMTIFFYHPLNIPSASNAVYSYFRDRGLV